MLCCLTPPAPITVVTKPNYVSHFAGTIDACVLNGVRENGVIDLRLRGGNVCAPGCRRVHLALVSSSSVAG
jgi:hypothetical protein